MRLIVILIAALWGIAAVIAFALTTTRSRDARWSTAYILGWPAVAVLAYLNEPLPLWIGVPVMFGFVPWLLAGPHLTAILQDPDRSRPGEFIGIPRAYWTWGGLSAVLLGLLFNGLA